MGENSKIEWTDHTFNPWWGCAKVSAGCKNCYAETMANRFGDWWGANGHRRLFDEKHWNAPIRWNAKAQKEGKRKKVFCGSMCDVLEDRDDLKAVLGQLIWLIIQTPWLDWLLLTKRAENFYLLPQDPPKNVWLGVSIENQEYADKRVPLLIKETPFVRFLSCEPLLGPLDLREYLPSIDWVIVGGESGPGARSMKPEWVRSIRDQCQEADTPFFFKQWGGVDKKAAGRLLDGREWNAAPTIGG